MCPVSAVCRAHAHRKVSLQLCVILVLRMADAHRKLSLQLCVILVICYGLLLDLITGRLSSSVFDLVKLCLEYESS